MLSLPRYLFFAVGILLIAYGLRIIQLDQMQLWVDETYTLDTIEITQSSGDFIAGMRPRLAHMPVYFASLLLYPDEHTKFSMRFPSVLFALLTIAMTMRIMSHIYLSPRWALLTGVILAFHAMLISHSRSARMYPMGNFLLASASYFFLRYNTTQHINGRLSAYALSFVAYLTHIAALILIPAQGLVKLRQYLTGKIPRQNLLLWIGLQMVLVAPAFIWAATIFNGTDAVLSWIVVPGIGRIVYVLQSMMLGIFNADVLSMWWLAVPVFAIPLLAYGVFIRQIRYAEYWLGLTLVPMIVALLATPIKPLFHERYFAIALFAYLLLSVLGLKVLAEKLQSLRYGRGIITVLISAYLLVILLFTILQMQNSYFIHPTLLSGT